MATGRELCDAIVEKMVKSELERRSLEHEIDLLQGDLKLHRMTRRQDDELIRSLQRRVNRQRRQITKHIDTIRRRREERDRLRDFAGDLLRHCCHGCPDFDKCDHCAWNIIADELGVEVKDD